MFMVLIIALTLFYFSVVDMHRFFPHVTNLCPLVIFFLAGFIAAAEIHNL